MGSSIASAEWSNTMKKKHVQVGDAQQQLDYKLSWLVECRVGYTNWLMLWAMVGYKLTDLLDPQIRYQPKELTKD